MADTKTLQIRYGPQLTLIGKGDWLADPLGGLRELRGLERALDKALNDTVSKARVAGHSWAEIGDALETTRQSAWERFRHGGEPPSSSR